MKLVLDTNSLLSNMGGFLVFLSFRLWPSYAWQLAFCSHFCIVLYQIPVFFLLTLVYALHEMNANAVLSG